MKIAVITITNNRLDSTKKYLPELKQKAGVEFNHIIVDNGSTDGTVEYLSKHYLTVKISENIGIIEAWKIGINIAIERFKPDLIVKVDNDCHIITDNVLSRIADFYNNGCHDYIVAPYDVAIPKELHPYIIAEGKERNESLMYVRHVGGIFIAMPTAIAKDMLKAPKRNMTGDLERGKYWNSKGKSVVYLKDVKIEHKGICNQSKNYTL